MLYSLRRSFLERWCPDGFIRDAVWIDHHDRRQRIPIAPDAFFILNVLDGKEAGRVHIFLEADRGTMDIARFTTKLRVCFAYWRSGKAERWGMKNFIVATVTRSAERAANLCKAAHSVNKRGLRMFLFASEAEYLPASGRKILEPIWRTPGDPTPHALTE